MQEQLLATLQHWENAFFPREYLLAFSGGRDSAALLHLLAQIRGKLAAPVKAVYINHGWHVDAKKWGEFCAGEAEKYGIPFLSHTLDLQPEKKDGGAEARARSGRYQVFAELLPKNGILLTAHHQDDQAETFVLQLLRGSGLEGLAAMPTCKNFAQGQHWRPLLTVSRAEINTYIHTHQIPFIDDPSNDDQHFRRNFLRQRIFPALKEVYPAAEKSIARTSAFVGESLQIQQQLLDQLLPVLSSVFPWSKICEQNYGEQIEKALLRRWLQRLYCPTPPAVRLESFLQQLRQTNPKNAQLDFAGLTLLHYHGEIYLFQHTTPASPPPVQANNDWDGIGEITIRGQENFSELEWTLFPCSGQFHPPEKRYPTNLKNLFQQQEIPPFLRRRIPILRRGKTILWVGELGSAKGAENLRIIWHKKAHSATILAE